nr:unnamed protein product [Callosobruchus analis]
MEVGFKKLWKPSQTVSQYLKNPSSSSYDEDDREFISGFLDTIQAKQESYDDTKVPTEVSAPTFNLNYSVLKSLYNICGYILQSIKNTSKTCSFCISAAGGKIPLYKSFDRFSILKRYRENCLFSVLRRSFVSF